MTQVFFICDKRHHDLATRKLISYVFFLLTAKLRPYVFNALRLYKYGLASLESGHKERGHCSFIYNHVVRKVSSLRLFRVIYKLQNILFIATGTVWIVKEQNLNRAIRPRYLGWIKLRVSIIQIIFFNYGRFIIRPWSIYRKKKAHGR